MDRCPYGLLQREVADVFHQLRKLGIWLYRAYAGKPAFKSGPFTPPATARRH